MLKVPVFLRSYFPPFGKPIPENTKTISSAWKMQRMLICEWFVYYLSLIHISEPTRH